eukprot:8068386-Pyramimonas_sp.AAC.1
MIKYRIDRWQSVRSVSCADYHSLLMLLAHVEEVGALHPRLPENTDYVFHAILYGRMLQGALDNCIPQRLANNVRTAGRCCCCSGGHFCCAYLRRSLLA